MNFALKGSFRRVPKGKFNDRRKFRQEFAMRTQSGVRKKMSFGFFFQKKYSSFTSACAYYRVALVHNSPSRIQRNNLSGNDGLHFLARAACEY